MLQAVFDLFYKLRVALTSRFSDPKDVISCRKAIYEFPNKHPEISMAVPLPPESWGLDAVDRMETLRSARDISLVTMSHRTSLAYGLIAPTVQSDEYLQRWCGILHYKYPYTQVDNGD